MNFRYLFLNLLFLMIFFISAINAKITIGLTGDVMLGRLVNEKILQTNFEYPWGNLLPILRKNDLNLINLETTLTKSSNAVSKVFNFKSDPINVQSLQEAKIDITNSANNHIKDFGNEGMFETLKTLDKAKIKHVGAGKNIFDAKKPIIINKNGIKIGIIGFTDNEPTWAATENKPGVNYINVNNFENIKSEITNLKKQVDILILTIHWGPNMRQIPTKEFIDFAHKALDAGVDIFHGHSAHIFQPIEIYNNKLIIYDSGDFVDDYAVDPQLRNDQSFLYLIDVEKEGIVGIKLLPVIISNMQVNIAKDNNFNEIAKKMINLSRKFNTQINIENDFLRVKI